MSETELLDTSIELLENGKRIRVARQGSGQAVLLLHGYPENLQIWSRLVPLLAERCQIIAFDWPGMGYSEAWPGGATPQLMAKRVVQLMDYWRIDRAVIVGSDMGGQPALVLAAEYPERVGKLVAMNSLVFGDEVTSWEIRLLRKFKFNRFALRHLASLVFRRAETTFLPPGVALEKRLRSDFWAAFARPEVRRFISKMCAGYQGMLGQLPEIYERIECPALVLWAEHDKHFPLVQGERLHQAISSSQFQVIHEGTHWMMLHDAETLAERILGWLDS